MEVMEEEKVVSERVNLSQTEEELRRVQHGLYVPSGCLSLGLSASAVSQLCAVCLNSFERVQSHYRGPLLTVSRYKAQ